MLFEVNFTLSAIKIFDDMFPSKRTPDGKIMTIERCFEQSEPINDWSRFGPTLKRLQKAYKNQDFIGRFGNDIIFVIIGNKVVRVQKYCTLSQRGFTPMALNSFNKHIAPRLEKQGLLGCISTDFNQKARPFMIAHKNLRLMEHLSEIYDLDELSFMASNDALYVIKDDQVERVFAYAPSQYEFDDKVTFTQHAQDRCKYYFKNDLRKYSGTVLQFLFNEFNHSKRNKAIYNNTALMADMYSAYPDIDPDLFTTDLMIMVIDKTTSKVVTLYPRNTSTKAHQNSSAFLKDKKTRKRSRYDRRSFKQRKCKSGSGYIHGSFSEAS